MVNTELIAFQEQISTQSCLSLQLVCSFLFSDTLMLNLQDNVLNIINQIMDECIPNDRANRDFCVKFPEEIRHDNLAGQLWFGAEVVYSLQLQSVGKQLYTSPKHMHRISLFHVYNCVVS